MRKKRPRTEAQIAASRANGALSVGRKSPEGIAKSALNSITHGFRAKFIALNNENREAYTAHLDAYIARYSPADKVEDDLVGLLATNMWQLTGQSLDHRPAELPRKADNHLLVGTFALAGFLVERNLFLSRWFTSSSENASESNGPRQHSRFSCSSCSGSASASR
jgi:hypothetical protein